MAVDLSGVQNDRWEVILKKIESYIEELTNVYEIYMMNSIGIFLSFQAKSAVFQVVSSAFAYDRCIIWAFWHDLFHHCHVNLFQLCCQNTIDFIIILADECFSINLIKNETRDWITEILKFDSHFRKGLEES
jgi:hypothetical protein